MRKIALATLTAAALVAGLGAASAAEPGEYQYFHETYGTNNPAAWSSNQGTWGEHRRGGMGMYGPAYGYAPEPYGYGYGPGVGVNVGGVGVGFGFY